MCPTALSKRRARQIGSGPQSEERLAVSSYSGHRMEERPLTRRLDWLVTGRVGQPPPHLVRRRLRHGQFRSDHLQFKGNKSALL